MTNQSKKRRSGATPKGRQIDPGALSQVRDALGAQPRERALLIEHLHTLQDRFGHLSTAHLVALASEMRLAMAEVYEVATFYAHFDVVDQGTAPPPAVTVRICDSLTCCMLGADKVYEETQARLSSQDVRVVRAPCMGACDTAPAAAIGHTLIEHADAEALVAAVGTGANRPIKAKALDAYRAEGGYDLLEKCLAGGVSADAVIQALDGSGLRGLGGAGFPTARKWSIVRDQPGPKAVAVNADEGEPGTFKDREFLETDPHRMLEGAMIGAWVVGASDVYIYLRDEYPEARHVLEAEIPNIEAAGIAPHVKLHLRRGAGAYICGEESAMIESIEGKRGLPRHRPPYVAQVGLFGRPTLVNNVETLFWVRDIVEKGAAWFADQGQDGHPGPRTYSVSGRVKNPGVKIAPSGTTVRQLIEDYCGGMADGHAFKAYLPGGPSGGILPASMGDLPLDFGQLEKYGSFVGSHAVVILSTQDSVKDAALNLMRFFAHESCGQCTPCRVGTEKAADLMADGNWDTALLTELSTAMRDTSICGLGQAASNPITSVMTYFSEDL